MKARTLKNLIMSLLVTCSFATTNTIAEDRFVEQDSEGFCTSFRLLTPDILTQHIRQSRSLLQQQRHEQAKRVEEQKFGVLDTIITIVLPGGLLYAAIKTNNHYEQQQKLTFLTQEINLLSGELLSLEAVSGNTRIAGIH